MHQNFQELLPPAAADWATGVRLIKIDEEDRNSIINRPGRSTYPKEKSVLTSGATPGYHTSRFVEGLLAQRIAPHVAINAAHYTTGLGEGTLESSGYRASASQIVCKRIEQFFGWGKTVGGLRKTRLRGVRHNKQLMCLTALAYNLVRLSRMCPATG